MTVRTKAELRTMQASMFADNSTGDITPEDLRDLLHDLIDSLSAGISHFSATGTTYSNVAHTISLGAAGYEGDTGTIVFWIAPSDLDYDESPLSLVIGGETRALLDVNGAAVGAHQVHPDAIYATQVLFAPGANRVWKLTSTLEKRPPPPLARSWARAYEALSDETADEIIAGGVTLAWIMAGYAAAHETAVIAVPEPSYVGYITAAIPASWWPTPFGYPARAGTFGNARWTLLTANAGSHNNIVYSIIYLNSRQSARGLGGTFTLRPLPT